MVIKKITSKEILVSMAIAAILFVVLGTLTGLWTNPFFERMANIVFLDYVILGFESILIGLLIGIKKGRCSIGAVTGGGILGFLGFACPVCNKLLLYIFGATFLLSYLEPIRHYIGLLGIFILSYLLYKKLCQTMATQKK